MEAPTPLRDLHWTPLEGPGMWLLAGTLKDYTGNVGEMCGSPG